VPKDSFVLSPRTAYGTSSFTNWPTIAQRQRRHGRRPPITHHHHSENRKRRNVLLIFADIARPNIAWPSIVQHLASIHPAVIHHNSTATISSRHVITLRPYLFCVSLLLSCLLPWTTYPFAFNFLPFSIRNAIRYLCTPTPPLTSIHPPLTAFAGL
jgi:hypothetical protein